MTEQEELAILRPYVTECGKLVGQNYELEKAYKATDKLLQSHLEDGLQKPLIKPIIQDYLQKIT
jgi:hypothetical protein